MTKHHRDTGFCGGCCAYCILRFICCCCLAHGPARKRFREAYGLEEGEWTFEVIFAQHVFVHTVVFVKKHEKFTLEVK